MPTKQFLQLLSTRKSFRLKSQGKSMFPILKENDMIFFKKIPFSRIKTGDIVVFRKKEQIIAHRVIYKNKKYLLTRGDNLPFPDGKVFPKQILGRVYQAKRQGKIFQPENFYLLQSTEYFAEILKIKKALEKEKINYLFLKGLPLHLFYEKKHPSRIYADCDLLVERGKNSLLAKIFQEMGYQKANFFWSHHLQKMMKEELETTYFRQTNYAFIFFDVHFLLTDLSLVHVGHFEEFYPQKLLEQLTQELLQAKRQVKIQQEFFPILKPVHLILSLALQIFHHNFRGFFRYEFLDKVIRQTIREEKRRKNFSFFKKTREPFSSLSLFSSLEKLIEKFQLKNFLFPVFFLLKKYYHTPLSPSFLPTLRPTAGFSLKRPSSFFNFLVFRFFSFLKIEIFSEEKRVQAGISRFLHLFLLSPQPWRKKIFLFFKPKIWYAVLWVFCQKLLLFLKIKRFYQVKNKKEK